MGELNFFSMKRVLLLALGMAAGDAMYQVLRHGFHAVDWGKVGFMFVFSAVVLAIVSKLRSAKVRN